MAKKKEKFQEIKPEMTPMIDVTFLLLIFFIVTLKFKTLEGRLDAALPKDRGTSNAQIEEIEKVDVVLKVANPGRLVPDPETDGRLDHFIERVITYEIGAQTFTDPERVRNFLQSFDKDETPVTIDARKGITYGDVVIILDVVVEQEFKQVAFAGSMENE